MVTQGTLLPEAAYEITGDLSGCTGGPAARRAAGPNKAPLLGGWSVYVAGALRSRQEVVQLVKATGATFLTRPPVGGARDAWGGHAQTGQEVVLYDGDDAERMSTGMWLLMVLLVGMHMQAPMCWNAQHSAMCVHGACRSHRCVSDEYTCTSNNTHKYTSTPNNTTHKYTSTPHNTTQGVGVMQLQAHSSLTMYHWCRASG